MRVDAGVSVRKVEAMDKREAEIHRLREALQKIADFGHADDCPCKMAPVYECGCYDKDQWEMAKEALRREGKWS